MYVKMMSDENLPDTDSRKSFKLLSGVDTVTFNRSPEAPTEAGPTAYIVFKDGTNESFLLAGNVYVMTDEGKTIEKFGPHPIT